VKQGLTRIAQYEAALRARQRKTAMPPSPKPGRKAASGAERTQRQRRHPTPRLNAEMASDTAFRIIAGRHLRDLTASHEATCRGDPEALHQMRLALTRLRTAILFFSPMIDDAKRARIKGELKWLNGQLGAVRDLDVAIERLKADNKPRRQETAYYRSWNERRADSHRHLARALRSARYRRLIDSISGWIQNGPWSIKKGKQAALERASPVATCSAGKLTRWRETLLKKCRKLAKMGAEKRHRLRLLNKKLTYSIEFFEDLFADKRFSRQQTALKHLRKAQRSLGQLNDDAKGHSLATALQRDGVEALLQFLSPKREKRLIRTAAAAYRKLAALKP
jgi:CHAD domain-containing protein